MNFILRKARTVVSRSLKAQRSRRGTPEGFYSFHTSKTQEKEFTGFGKPQWSIKESFLTRDTQSDTISREDLLKSATLAGLAVSEDKIPHLLSDLDNILQSVKKIQRVDTTGVTPLLSVLEHVPLKQREDIVDTNNSTASDTSPDGVSKILELAPVRSGQFYVVPKQKADFEDDIE